MEKQGCKNFGITALMAIMKTSNEWSKHNTHTDRHTGRWEEKNGKRKRPRLSLTVQIPLFCSFALSLNSFRIQFIGCKYISALLTKNLFIPCIRIVYWLCWYIDLVISVVM